MSDVAVLEARWVFGYGSLMWRPGFPHVETRPGRLIGAHRSLCVFSHVHRGTPERPGLVMGLNNGGACRGMVFRVADGDWPEVLAYLRAREQVTNVYLESVRPVRLDDGSSVAALCYLVDRHHRQYAGELPDDVMVEIISGSTGQSGPNRDYVFNTVAHLREMGVTDRRLFALADRLAERSG